MVRRLERRLRGHGLELPASSLSSRSNADSGVMDGWTVVVTGVRESSYGRDENKELHCGKLRPRLLYF